MIHSFCIFKAQIWSLCTRNWAKNFQPACVCTCASKSWVEQNFQPHQETFIWECFNFSTLKPMTTPHQKWLICEIRCNWQLATFYNFISPVGVYSELLLLQIKNSLHNIKKSRGSCTIDLYWVWWGVQRRRLGATQSGTFGQCSSELGKLTQVIGGGGVQVSWGSWPGTSPPKSGQSVSASGRRLTQVIFRGFA